MANTFTIRGARGTMPACGRDFLEYGGNTTCFTLETDEHLFVFDAGSGLSSVGRERLEQTTPPPITILFTHFHLDHLLGLPTFEPLYDADAQITLMADPRRETNWQTDLQTFMQPPFFPVGLGESGASMTLEDLPVDEGSLCRHGLSIAWFDLPHPQRCLAYRVECEAGAFVIATDAEYGAEIDPRFLSFCRNADFLLFDAHYEPAEYKSHRGWGHSTWKTAAGIAERAGIGRLILTHHAPSRTDAEISRIEGKAQAIFGNTVAAADGMAITT